jgi:peptidyl-Asp metalloendopeptidase
MHSSDLVRTILLVLGLALLPDGALAQPAGEPLLLDAITDASAPVPGHAVRSTAREGRFNTAALLASRVHVTLGDGRDLAAERREEVRGSRGETSWIGEFADAPGSLLVMTIHRGVVSGFLHHGADVYEIGTGRAGRVVLYQVDEDRLPGEGEPVPVTSGDAPDASADGVDVVAAVSVAGDVVAQDLLVVYTPKAVARAGSVATLESRILNAVAAANAAYTNSAVGIRLNVVGLAQTSYTETGDMGVTLSRLRSTTDGHMDEVHALRNQTGADLVALISDDGNYCGIAYVMSTVSAGFASSAFSVTNQTCFSNQTLAHEIGHNQGNAHDRANGGSASYAYAYGYRTCDNIAYTNGQSFRTVMAYSCSGTPRLNYFSNPRVYYNGAPMGVDYELDPARSADNARALNNTAGVTAGFRSAPATAPPATPASLTATTVAADRIALTWVDRSGDESGFLLQRAVGGGSFSDRATLGSNVTSFTDTGLTASTTYHYRVRAYNGAGASAYTDVASATTANAPVAPASPSPATVAVSGSTASVSWADVTGETGYTVLRETRNSKTGKWSGTTFSTGADVTVLTQSLAAGTYRYSVRAVNAAGASAYVTATCATCGSDGAFTIGGSSGGDTGSGGGGGKGNGKDK